MDKAKRLIIITLVIILSAGVYAFAQEETQGTHFLKAIEVSTGYGRASLKGNQPAYEFYPINLDFDFDLKPLLRKVNFNYAPLFEFQLETFASPVGSPNANVEAGGAFMLKAGIFPETWQFQPYIKGGVGMLYMSQHTIEQGTQFNFLEQGCAGAHFYLDKHWALNGEFRFRHVSNAGIDQPNSGINSMLYLVGATYQF